MIADRSVKLRARRVTLKPTNKPKQTKHREREIREQWEHREGENTREFSGTITRPPDPASTGGSRQPTRLVRVFTVEILGQGWVQDELIGYPAPMFRIQDVILNHHSFRTGQLVKVVQRQWGSREKRYGIVIGTMRRLFLLIVQRTLFTEQLSQVKIDGWNRIQMWVLITGGGLSAWTGARAERRQREWQNKLATYNLAGRSVNVRIVSF